MKTRAFAGLLPGLFLCLAISVLAIGLSKLGSLLTNLRLIDPFTGAILIGILVRTFAAIPPSFASGIRCGTISVLEIAVILLGFSLSFDVFHDGDLAFVLFVMLLVACMILAGFTLCRAVGLPEGLSLLIACGNAICGNAAIAAVAPAVGAGNEDVVAAITFSSILGVLFVLLLPALAPFIGLNAFQFGTFAGLTVYAVPQVVAATAPVSMVSAQVGTTIKLIRVLMLVPAVLLAPLLLRNREKPSPSHGKPHIRLVKVLPWFIPGFLLAAALNNLGCVPESVGNLTSEISRGLFVVAMSGLGLSVDLRRLVKIGPALILGVTLSLVMLAAVSFLFVLSFA
ncbi:putative sulfate exporter family transporter [Stappia sp. BW2]|uniref:YeiH family protein n=1 Tax=Stappia sp. BW2 TaxID=2592622 RepID=UPI0011DEA56C|nr:putative sulfate exporter family transporter [Stappia sp. BW2]TYC64083.1 putative sulfate exporter family transporter [Stappia sp. BW2]